MKTRILYIIVTLFILSSCDDKYKNEMLFIEQIIRNPKDIEKIIKTSKYYSESITDTNFASTIDYLLRIPVNLEKFEFIMYDPDEPDKDDYYQLSFEIIEDDEPNNFVFTFIKKENEDWKFQNIGIVINYLP